MLSTGGPSRHSSDQGVTRLTSSKTSTHSRLLEDPTAGPRHAPWLSVTDRYVCHECRQHVGITRRWGRQWNTCVYEKSSWHHSSLVYAHNIASLTRMCSGCQEGVMCYMCIFLFLNYGRGEARPQLQRVRKALWVCDVNAAHSTNSAGSSALPWSLPRICLKYLNIGSVFKVRLME